MEYDIPPSSQQDGMPSFSSDEARDFFEENATDLASLYFSKEKRTKSSTISDIELIPEWDKIMESGNSSIRLFEIPIRSNASNVFEETQFKEEKNVSNKRFISERRLVIAHKSNGETCMFVTTLVPFERSINKANKSLKKFRYLSCGDFTGQIFCSTLEGQFVKAFSLTNGKLDGQLRVHKRTDFEKQKQTHNIKDYTVIRLHVENQIATRSYSSSSESCVEAGVCQDGCGCLDEVVVTPGGGGSTGGGWPTPGGGSTGGGSTGGGWPTPGGGNNNSNQPSYNKISTTTIATKSTAVIATYSTAAHRAGGKNDGTPLARCNFGVRDMFNGLFTGTELNNMRANDIVNYWAANPTKWQPITISEALTSVNNGWFVVAGQSNASGSGHVVVLVPGAGVSRTWNGNTTLCPNAMETGYNMRWTSNSITSSWGRTKHKDVKFYRYK